MPDSASVTSCNRISRSSAALRAEMSMSTPVSRRSSRWSSLCTMLRSHTSRPSAARARYSKSARPVRTAPTISALTRSRSSGWIISYQKPLSVVQRSAAYPSSDSVCSETKVNAASPGRRPGTASQTIAPSRSTSVR